MHISIDVSQYLRLPGMVRAQFDGWLTAETLTEERIVRLTLGEGAIEVERICLGSDGKPYLGKDGEIATEVVRFPVKSTPPVEAFEDEAK